MAAVCPQVWMTPYGITDSNVKSLPPMPPPMIFASKSLQGKLQFQPYRVGMPFICDTLYGITGSDDFDCSILKPLLFAYGGRQLTSSKITFFPAMARLPAPGDTLYGRTDADTEQAGIPKPLIFLLKDDMQQVFHPLTVQPQVPGATWKLEGITKDETGTATPGFTVYLFNVTSGIPVLEQVTISDGAGNYSFTVEEGHLYWVTSYKSGTPDKAGATRNDLIGTFS